MNLSSCNFLKIIASLATIGFAVSCGVPNNNGADSINPPSDLGSVLVQVAGKSEKSFGGGFSRSAIKFNLKAGWSANANMLSSTSGARVVLTFAHVLNSSDMSDFKEPPSLTQTSYRRITGNGWHGYVEHNPDAMHGDDSVDVKLVKDDVYLGLLITWPSSSGAARSDCDDLIRRVVWTISELPK